MGLNANYCALIVYRNDRLEKKYKCRYLTMDKEENLCQHATEWGCKKYTKSNIAKDTFLHGHSGTKVVNFNRPKKCKKDKARRLEQKLTYDTTS